MRRIFPFFLVLCLCCTFLFFPISASAQEVVHYASVPRPVSSEFVRYIVADNSTQTYPTIYRISIPELIDSRYVSLYLSCSSSGVLDLHVHNSSGISFNLVVERFSLSGNFIAVYNKNLSSDDTAFTTVLHFTYPNMGYIDPCDIPILDPDGLFNFGVPSIAWSDETDPAVYTQWLQALNDKLNSIDKTASDAAESLDLIEAELSLFVDSFNSYKNRIISNTDDIAAGVETLVEVLSLFYLQNHSDLLEILAKLEDIYDLLAQEQESQPLIEQESQIQDFIQAESELNKDFSGDLQNQFNIAGNVFHDYSAYSFITNLMQSLVLSNVKINSLLIYALAIGLCVLVLGRKLNAG